jgi:hypothetical protein
MLNVEPWARCPKKHMPQLGRPLLIISLVAFVLTLASQSALAQNVTTVSSCPGQEKLPVTFEVDCSHVKDAADRQLCRPFIENQACKVFPIYRRITGIKLEQDCPSIKFTIYEDDNWPNPRGEGGLATHCKVDYLVKYGLKARANSPLGPYDVHELLHEYQFSLGPLPSMHPLFSSSMAEAERSLGDTAQYQRDTRNMQSEAQRLKDELENGKYKGSPKECSLAQAQVEESLYLENPKLVEMFYLKLPPAKGNSQQERDARFNRMFYTVSSANAEVKKMLTDHGCGQF